MADLLLARRLRRRYNSYMYWRLRDSPNPFDLEEIEFVQRFRLSRIAVKYIVEGLKPFISLGRQGYSLELHVLNTLSLLGSGSFQRTIADGFLHRISQSSISKSLDIVLNAFQPLISKYIKLPISSAELQTKKHHFFVDIGFPNVIGAIDCTHINIKKPSCDDWFLYLNRKSNFSVNVQMVCDSKMHILDVVARWPRSTHDARMWSLSCHRQVLSSGIIPENNFLLEDSGYPLEPWLLTPYQDVTSPAEEIFNVKHRKARNIVERCFGVLKSRFRILDKSAGIMCYSPEKVCSIIIVTAMLHNICRRYNIHEPPSSDTYDEDNEDDLPYDGNESGLLTQARAIRNGIALQFQARW